MSVEIDIHKELEFKIKAKRERDALVKRRIEPLISTDIKNDVFISTVCDELLKNSEPNDIDWSEPLRVDNELSNGNSWRESHEKDQTALRPRIQDISSSRA